MKQMKTTARCIGDNIDFEIFVEVTGISTEDVDDTTRKYLKDTADFVMRNILTRYNKSCERIVVYCNDECSSCGQRLQQGGHGCPHEWVGYNAVGHGDNAQDDDVTVYQKKEDKTPGSKLPDYADPKAVDYYIKCEDNISNRKRLCERIQVSGFIPGYIVDQDQMSGGIMIFPVSQLKESEAQDTLFATPFFDGDGTPEWRLPLQLMDKDYNIVKLTESDRIPNSEVFEDNLLVRIDWTGDIEKDAELWKEAVVDLLSVHTLH